MPAEGAWEFGYRRGNHEHFTERHEHGASHHFKSKVRWGDKLGGYGEVSSILSLSLPLVLSMSEWRCCHIHRLVHRALPASPRVFMHLNLSSSHSHCSLSLCLALLRLQPQGDWWRSTCSTAQPANQISLQQSELRGGIGSFIFYCCGEQSSRSQLNRRSSTASSYSHCLFFRLHFFRLLFIHMHLSHINSWWHLVCMDETGNATSSIFTQL